MANYLELFFGTIDDTEAMVTTLGELLNTEFAESDKDYADYLAHDGRRHYDLVLQHDEPGDDVEDDLPFTAMPHVLTLRGDRDMDDELRAVGEDLIGRLGEHGYTPARLLYGSTEVVASID